MASWEGQEVAAGFQNWYQLSLASAGIGTLHRIENYYALENWYICFWPDEVSPDDKVGHGAPGETHNASELSAYPICLRWSEWKKHPNLLMSDNDKTTRAHAQTSPVWLMTACRQTTRAQEGAPSQARVECDVTAPLHVVPCWQGLNSRAIPGLGANSPPPLFVDVLVFCFCLRCNRGRF